jgi:hypothetical protein
MSFRATLLRRSHLLVILLGLITAPAAFGQAQDASGHLISPVAFANEDAITTSFVPAPNIGGTSGGGSSDVGQWLKVEFHYGTTPVLTTKYLDEVQFKIWIEGLDLLAKNAPVPGKGVAVVMTGEVTYVNVPAGKDLYGSFYVHPNTIGRYSSRDAEDFDRKFNIHVEAYVGGQLMDQIDKRKEKDPAWFKPILPTSFIVRTNVPSS